MINYKKNKIKLQVYLNIILNSWDFSKIIELSLKAYLIFKRIRLLRYKLNTNGG